MALKGGSMPLAAAGRAPTDWKAQQMQQRIRQRYAAERRFRLLGLFASGSRAAAWFASGLPVDFRSAPVMVDPAMLKDGNADMILSSANLPAVTAQAARDALGPDGERLISSNSWLALRKAIKADPTLLTQQA